MFILWSVLLALGLALFSFFVDAMFNGEHPLFEETTAPRTVTGPFRRFRENHEFVLFRNLRNADADSRRRIIIPSVIALGAMLLAGWLANGIWSDGWNIVWCILAALAIISVIGLIVYYVVWWFQGGETLRELAAFVPLFVLMWFPLKAAMALVNASLLGWGWIDPNSQARSFIKDTIPVVVMIIVAGLLLFHYFHRRWREGGRTQRWLMALAIIMLCIAIVASSIVTARGAGWEFPASKNGGGTVQNIAGTPGPTAADLDAAIADLTIPEVTPEELETMESTERFQDISWKLLDSSLASKDKSRTESTGFSDALTFGFKAKDDDGRYREIYEETLRNPVYAMTVVRALINKEIAKGQTFGDLNPWMAKAIQRDDAYGVVGWCEYRDGDRSVLYVTTEFRCIAATLCNLYDRLISQGIQTRQTVENWCLNAALSSNDRKGVLASYQYKKEAWVLMWIGKDEAESDNPKGLFVIGFNTHDKRPEFFGEEDPPEVVKTPSIDDGGTPKTTPTSPSNPKGDDPTTAPTEAPTQPSGAKNPKDDPVNNNNANKGGGDNRTSDGSGDFQTSDPRNETQNPGTVRPQAPTVVPEHRNDDIVDHEDAPDYTPDPVTDRGPVDNQSPQTSPDGDGEFVPDD